MAEMMGDSVLYTEVKFNKDEETIKAGKEHFSSQKTEAHSKWTISKAFHLSTVQSFSKLTWILVFAVLILIIAVVGMTAEVVRLHSGHSCARLSSQPNQCDCELASTGPPRLTANPCHCGPQCPFGWLLHKGQCYVFFSKEQNRMSALSSCSNNGSQLADTEDLDTLKFLRQHMDTKFYWIGLKKTGHDLRWLWNGGRPLNRTNYFNNFNHHDKDCAMVSKDKIYAESCNTKRVYICERKARF